MIASGFVARERAQWATVGLLQVALVLGFMATADCGGDAGVGGAVPADGGSPDADGPADAATDHDDSGPPPFCYDGVSNGTETGLDCGGPDCEPCSVGEPCATDADCEESYCTPLEICGAAHGATLSTVGPQDVPCPTGAIEIAATDDAAAVVAAHDSAQVYCFRPGLHRLSGPLMARDDDSYVGMLGAIISGAIVLDNWAPEGNAFKAVVPGGIECTINHDRASCNCPAVSEDGWDKSEYVYFNDAFLRWVPSPAEVISGTFHLDCATGEVFIADDPSGAQVELGVVGSAVQGTRLNITVRNLVFEKFANPAGNAAVLHAAANSPGGDAAGWVIEDCELRLNHGRAISAGTRADSGPGAAVRRNYVHHNGWLGMGANNTRGVIIGNDVAHNNLLKFHYGWGAGGMKMGGTDDGVWEHNWIHDNFGPGLWCDVACGADGDNIIRFNTLEGNDGAGIHYEISFNAAIHNNLARNNAVTGTFTAGDGAGIVLRASQRVDVYDNLLSRNHAGITAISSLERGAIEDVQIHDNVVDLGLDGQAGFFGNTDPSTGNLWDANRYLVCDTGAELWHTRAGLHTFSEWQQLGFDEQSSIELAANCP